MSISTSHKLRAGALALAVIGLVGCNSPTGPDENFDLSDSITLQGGIVLVFQDFAALAQHRDAIVTTVDDSLTIIRPLIDVDNTTIIARHSSDNVIPEIGMGGRADQSTVTLTFDGPLVADAIANWLFPLLAHELHHTARMRGVGYGDDLLGAMISEGLADQFAVQIAGIAPPPWSSALTPAELAEWSENAKANWFNTSYNHSAWFFGTGAPPRWAGYTIGFDMTGKYLGANPGSTAASLVNTPATVFIE